MAENVKLASSASAGRFAQSRSLGTMLAPSRGYEPPATSPAVPSATSTTKPAIMAPELKRQSEQRRVKSSVRTRIEARQFRFPQSHRQDHFQQLARLL